MATPKIHGLGIVRDMTGPSISIDSMDSGEPSFPTLHAEVYDPITLPDGDFFFLGVGHKTQESEREEDDGTKCYTYDIEIHAIQPFETIEEEKAALSASDLLDKNFDKAADKMLSLKEKDTQDAKDSMGDGDGPDDESESEDMMDDNKD